MNWMNVLQLVDGRKILNVINLDLIVRVIDRGSTCIIVTADGKDIEVAETMDDILSVLRAAKN